MEKVIFKNTAEQLSRKKVSTRKNPKSRRYGKAGPSVDELMGTVSSFLPEDIRKEFDRINSEIQTLKSRPDVKKANVQDALDVLTEQHNIILKSTAGLVALAAASSFLASGERPSREYLDKYIAQGPLPDVGAMLKDFLSL